MSTRLERAAHARKLRDRGLLLREIGEEMGVSPKTVHAWLVDPDGSQLKARKDSYAGRCVDCGARTSGCNGYGPAAPVRCAHCNGPYVAALRKVWTPAAIIAAIQEWARIHDGEHPTLIAWNPSHARALGCEPSAEFLAEPGRWPHAHTVMREFSDGGTYRGGWRAAMVAAGFTPRKPGQTLAMLRAAA